MPLSDYKPILDGIAARVNEKGLRNPESKLNFTPCQIDPGDLSSFSGTRPAIALHYLFAGRHGTLEIRQRLQLANSALWLNPNSESAHLIGNHTYDIADAVKKAALSAVTSAPKGSLASLFEVPEIAPHIAEAELMLLFLKQGYSSQGDLRLGGKVLKDGTWASAIVSNYLMVPNGNGKPIVLSPKSQCVVRAVKSNYLRLLDYFADLTTGTEPVSDLVARLTA